MTTKKVSRSIKSKYHSGPSQTKFQELIDRFERTISVLGRSQSTFRNYALHVASIALYFGKIPTELDPEQVYDYLFYLQKKSKTPSQTYFKHITAFDFCLNLRACLMNTCVYLR
jgi:hypothetical protein